MVVGVVQFHYKHHTTLGGVYNGVPLTYGILIHVSYLLIKVES